MLTVNVNSETQLVKMQSPFLWPSASAWFGVEPHRPLSMLIQIHAYRGRVRSPQTLSIYLAHFQKWKGALLITTRGEKAQTKTVLADLEGRSVCLCTCGFLPLLSFSKSMRSYSPYWTGTIFFFSISLTSGILFHQKIQVFLTSPFLMAATYCMV